jgi:hypothetical protein
MFIDTVSTSLDNKVKDGRTGEGRKKMKID